VKEPKLFFVVFKVISKREENGADFCGYYNVEKRNKRDRSSVLTRDNPREALLFKHLGILLGSIRIQNLITT